jgi:hypothetical protein
MRISSELAGSRERFGLAHRGRLANDVRAEAHSRPRGDEAIVFECSFEAGGAKCGAKVVLPADGAEHPPDRCPKGHGWDWNDPASYLSSIPSMAPHVSFLHSLRKLRDPLVEKNSGFKIFLELDEPKQ